MPRGERRVIRAGTVSCGAEGTAPWLRSEVTGQPSQLVQLPPRNNGLGGMDLVVSPDERFVALSVYSGQSSQGFDLFSVNPLTRLGGMPETRGEGSPPVFSPSSRWVVSLLSFEPRVRGTGEYFETIQDPEADEVILVDWATLYFFDVDRAVLSSIAVGVEVRRSADLDEVLAWQTSDAVSFRGDTLVLRMPWGESLEERLPPTSPITARLSPFSPTPRR